MKRAVDVSLGALAVAVALFAACTLNIGNKPECLRDEDCVGGARCDNGRCSQAGDSDAEAGRPVGNGVLFSECEPLSADRACEPTPDGTPLTCYPSSMLAGKDFCVAKCDPSAPVDDPAHFTCDPFGALLPVCHPDTDPSAQVDCPSGLSCYRNNLSYSANSGVCLPIPVCTDGGECPSSHGSCGANVLKDLAPNAASSPLLHIDHLNCVHRYCHSQLSACASNEVCLGSQFAGSTDDLCVPRCLGNDHYCPPDFSCNLIYDQDGPEYECLPTVPGARCTGNDCLVGSCEETSAGFSVCSVGCPNPLLSCDPLNSRTNAFLCVTDVDAGRCATPASFSGANCGTSSQCDVDAGEFCSSLDRFGPILGHGECRLPCAADGTCGPRGGFPQGCLWNGDGGCFPALVGVPCTPETGCVPPLECADVTPEPHVISMGSRVCTRTCSADTCSPDGGVSTSAECAFPTVGGYCAGGWCRPPRQTGEACSCDAQCSSQMCDPSTLTCRTLN